MNRRKNTFLIAAAVLLLCGAVFVGGVAGDDPLPQAGGSLTPGEYYLENDLQLNANLSISGTCTIDLRGHVLKGTGSGSVITVNSGGTLTVTDSNPNSDHHFSTSVTPWVWDNCETTGGVIKGGCITGGNATNGGGVYVGGTFNMNGGNIVGNTATGNSDNSGGGGVYVNSGRFEMTGGSITGNRTTGTASSVWTLGGGGVYVNGSGSTFEMSGTAKIQNNTADGNNHHSGGGVFLNSGEFTMDGDSIIQNNTAKHDGGGVYVTGNSATAKGKFTMSGDASIIENITADHGGGVCTWVGTFTMNDGEIKGNKVTATDSSNGYGGGVYVNGACPFEMKDGIISGNSAKCGGGVSVGGSSDPTPTFTMTGGEIKNNTARQNGGGVYVANYNNDNSIFNVSGSPVISGNTKKSGGVTFANNVYLETNKTITITDQHLSSGASIGVTVPLPDASSVSPVEIATGATDGEENYFHGDAMGYASEATFASNQISLEKIHVAKVGETKYFTVAKAVSEAAAGNTITMIADSREQTVSISKVVTIDLAGHVLTSDGSGSVISVLSGGNLTVKDNSTATHYFRIPASGPWECVDSTASAADKAAAIPLEDITDVSQLTSGKVIKVTGGCITGGSGTKINNDTLGGGVYVKGGTFSMTGGNIVGNSAFDGEGKNGHGGGVYVADGGTFTMNGGTITGNTTTSGGGVYVYSGTFKMINSDPPSPTHGTITGNTAKAGGGVWVGGSGTSKGCFTMSGDAIIKGNTATADGGGVQFDSHGTFTMDGTAIITENTAQNGGGVYVGGMFTMMGSAHITDNTASKYGGGVLVAINGTFNVRETPVISGNKIEGDDNNVYLYGTETITVTNSLEDGADIRIVSPDTENTPIATGAAADESAGYAGYTVKDSDATYFHADSGKWVAKAEEGSGCADSKLKWSAATYTVTIQSNNDSYGSVSPESVPNVPGGTSISVSDSTLMIGTVTVTASPTAADDRYSYAFVGWKAGSDDVPETVTGDLTITANFSQTAKKYTVTFDANGGETEADPSQINETYNSKYILPTTEPTRTGYTFAGWWTEESGGTEITESTTVENTSAHTLYAHWNANTYTVTFDKNGGGDPETIEETYDSTYILPETNPERSGYTFAGWFTGQTDGDEVTSDTVVKTAEDHTLYAHWTKNSSGSSYKGTSVWATQTYTVTFSMNGHGEEIPAQYVTAGSCAKEPVPAPAADGFVFSGWYTDQGCTVLYDFSTPVTADLTLYAGWDAVSPAVPVTQTPAGKSPAPFAGVLAGLGGALAVFGLRMRRK